MSKPEPIIVVNGAELSMSQSEAVHFAISYLLAELNEAKAQGAFAGAASTYQMRLREVIAIITGEPFSMSYCCRTQRGRHMHAADVQLTAAAETPILKSMLDKVPPQTRGQVNSVTREQAPLVEWENVFPSPSAYRTSANPEATRRPMMKTQTIVQPDAG